MVLGLDSIIEAKIRGIIADQGASSKVDVKGSSIKIEDVHFDESLIEETLAKATGVLPPVIIEMIYVKSLTLIIPWTGGELGVYLDGVHVLLRRRSDEEVTPEQLWNVKELHVNALLADLIARIKAATKGGQAQDDDSDDDQDDGKESFAERMLQKMIAGLANKILKNLEPKIEITNLHLRYEDLQPESEAPVAFGLAFGFLKLDRTDFRNSIVCLKLDLGDVGVYVHTHAMGVTSMVPPATKAGKKDEAQCALNMAALLVQVSYPPSLLPAGQRRQRKSSFCAN